MKVIVLLAILLSPILTLKSQEDVGDFIDFDSDFLNQYFYANLYDNPYGFNLGTVDSVRLTDGDGLLLQRGDVRRGSTIDFTFVTGFDSTLIAIAGDRQMDDSVQLVLRRFGRSSTADTFQANSILKEIMYLRGGLEDSLSRHFSYGGGAVNLYSFDLFNHDTQENLVTHRTYSDIGADRLLKDSSSYTYDGQGRIASAYRYVRQNNALVLQDYVNATYGPGNLRTYEMGYSTDSDGWDVIYFISGDDELQAYSVLVRHGADTSTFAELSRVDDGSIHDFREYLIIQHRQAFREKWYYDGPISNTAEPDLIPGTLTFANPITVGLDIHYEGLPAASSYRIINAMGQVQEQGRLQTEGTLSWQQGTGLHYLIISAPGFQARAWPIVSQ